MDRALKHYVSRCLHGRAAFALFLTSAAIVSPSAYDVALALTDKLPALDPARPTASILNSTVLNFVLALITLSLAVYFIHLSEKKRKSSVEGKTLVFNKNTAEIASIGQSKVHAFCGSITQASDIDIVVTSENTDLDLGTSTGTSVSGRMRSMAATRNPAGDVVRDNLGEFIRQWKLSRRKADNFQLGFCLECDSPYEAARINIRTIIFAVAIRKNQDGMSTIDEQAINEIVKFAIDTAVRKGEKSIFIPVFGLGSGNAEQAKAIAATTNAVKGQLQHTTSTLDIYLGVYRADDLIQLCASIARTLPHA